MIERIRFCTKQNEIRVIIECILHVQNGLFFFFLEMIYALHYGLFNVKDYQKATLHHLFSASICSNGCEGEDAVVQGGWVVVVLQYKTKQLQQLTIVRLKWFRVGLHHLVEEQEANLLGKKSTDIYRLFLKK